MHYILKIYRIENKYFDFPKFGPPHNEGKFKKINKLKRKLKNKKLKSM